MFIFVVYILLFCTSYYLCKNFGQESTCTMSSCKLLLVKVNKCIILLRKKIITCTICFIYICFFLRSFLLNVLFSISFSWVVILGFLWPFVGLFVLAFIFLHNNYLFVDFCKWVKYWIVLWKLGYNYYYDYYYWNTPVIAISWLN